MGQTKLQKFIFTLMICFFMVLGMTIYNMLLIEGWSDQFLIHLVKDFWLGFFVALCLDVFLVGPIAKSIAIKIVKPNRGTKQIKIIIAISLCMVSGMVLCMSMFGSIKAVGFTSKALQIYPFIIIRNVVVALPLIALVNPTVRFLFLKIFPSKVATAQSKVSA